MTPVDAVGITIVVAAIVLIASFIGYGIGCDSGSSDTRLKIRLRITEELGKEAAQRVFGEKPGQEGRE